MTAFKSLKPRQREAVLERMLADKEFSADFADTLALEARPTSTAPAFPPDTEGTRHQGVSWQIDIARVARKELADLQPQIGRILMACCPMDGARFVSNGSVRECRDLAVNLKSFRA